MPSYCQRGPVNRPSRPSRHAILGVLAVASVVLSGCAGLASDSGADASELQERALAETADVATYSFESSTSVEYEDRDVSVHIHGAGVVDDRNERAAITSSTAYDVADGTLERPVDVYVVDGTAYVYSERTDRWEATPVGNLTAAGADEPWSGAELEAHRALLEGASVTAAGTETVDGRATTVVEVEPTREAMEAYVDRTGFADVEVLDAAVTHWITDEGRVVRSSVDTTVRIDGADARVTATASFDDFDESVDVELPAGAPS